jgi:hypothetical protein
MGAPNFTDAEKAKSLGLEIQRFASDLRSDALGNVADADGWLRHDLYSRLHDLGARVTTLDADPALVAMDNAEEVEPEGDELAALEEARRLDDGSRLTLDEVRAELGIGEETV